MPSALLNVMVNAAKKASVKIRRDFNELENLQVSVKGPGDFVTSADIRTQKIIIDELTKAKPDWSFFAEEKQNSNANNSKNRFIIDPIDGTTNFLHGNPNFAISIAAEVENRLEAGIIYSPVYDELFFAERGKGAFFNDRRLRVAQRKKLSECIIGTGIPFGERIYNKYLNEIDKISRKKSRKDLNKFESFGVDIWNAYEFSYLLNGKPKIIVLEISIPSNSLYTIESKSMKLFLNSFYNKNCF